MEQSWHHGSDEQHCLGFQGDRFMRKFRVLVNGNAYEVEIEEIDSQNTSSSPLAIAEKAPTTRSVPAAQKPAAASPSSSVAELTDGFVTAQMPGTIIDIHINHGDQVARGDKLLTLEAMKMANEVVAPHDGVISEIKVIQGASVNAGDVLVILG